MTTTPTVLILTDSLAFPRSAPEVVHYEDTWVALLKRKFPQVDFVHCGRGGATIDDLFKHSAYYHKTARPALVLMQCGVVDCAPRALTFMEQQLLQRLPVLGPIISKIVRKNASQIRRWRKMSYTSLANYEAWVEVYEKLFANVYWIEILPADANYESRVHGISKAITSYNEVLRQRRCVSTTDFTSNYIMSDLHHLNSEGHKLLAQRLTHIVQQEVI